MILFNRTTFAYAFQADTEQANGNLIKYNIYSLFCRYACMYVVPSNLLGNGKKYLKGIR